MIIKVCGMKDAANVIDLAALNVDFIGFIFYPLSKRYVGEPGIDLMSSIPGTIKKTGVFVDEEPDRLVDVVMQYNLDAVQLHGDESPEYCRLLRKMIHNFNTEKPVDLIKAFGIDSDFDFRSLSAYEEVVDYFLFDTSSAERGGSGKTFDWNLLKNYNGLTPFFLSGGLGTEHADKLKSISHPQLLGFDLNSRFEESPGYKDIGMLRHMIQTLRDGSGSQAQE